MSKFDSDVIVNSHSLDGLPRQKFEFNEEVFNFLEKEIHFARDCYNSRMKYYQTHISNYGFDPSENSTYMLFKKIEIDQTKWLYQLLENMIQRKKEEE